MIILGVIPARLALDPPAPQGPSRDRGASTRGPCLPPGGSSLAPWRWTTSWLPPIPSRGSRPCAAPTAFPRSMTSPGSPHRHRPALGGVARTRVRRLREYPGRRARWSPPGHIQRLVQPFFDDPSVQVTTLKIRAKPEEVTSAHGQQGRDQYPRRRPVLLAPAHPLRPRQPRGRRLLEAPRASTPIVARRSSATTRCRPLRWSRPSSSSSCGCWRTASRSGSLETDEPTVGVDTEDDLRAVEALLARRGHAPAS